MNKLMTVLRYTLVAGVLAVSAISCSTPEPPKPSNEAKNKLHEDPFRADFILTEGRISEDKWGAPDQLNSAYSTKITDPTYIQGAKQTLRYRLSKDAGWAIVSEDGTTKRLVVKHSPEGDAERIVYSFYVRYFNQAGDEITDQFIYNNQDRIHQHFFMATRVSKDINGKDEETLAQKFSQTPWDYRYADTEKLEDDNSKYIGDRNPIGLKGLISFKNVPGKRDMMLRLIHSGTSKFDTKGETSKFYRPSSFMSAQQNDIFVAIPIEIQ